MGKAFYIALCSAALLSAAPAAASVTDGVERWRAGDYRDAVMLWLPAAARGNSHALFNLGLAHRHGRGVPKDLDRAEDFFRRAAAKGHEPARTYLGIFHARRGEEAKAIELWQKSADAGDPHARYMLGVRLFNGKGVRQDWSRAYGYMLLADSAGVKQARKALAKMTGLLPETDKERGRTLASRIARENRAAGTTRDAERRDREETASAPAAAAVDTAAPAAAASSDAREPQAAAANSQAGGFRVQLGAYDRESVARASWEQISTRHPDLLGGMNPVFASFEGGVRLQVGNYRERALAAERCAALQAEGGACFVATAD